MRFHLELSCWTPSGPDDGKEMLFAVGVFFAIMHWKDEMTCMHLHLHLLQFVQFSFGRVGMTSEWRLET